MTSYAEKSVDELVLLLVTAPANIDFLNIEDALTRKLSDEDVCKIAPLLTSSDKEQNVLGIRVLAESVVDVTDVYEHVERLLRRDDRLLNRLCADLLIDRTVFNDAIVHWFGKFIESDDEPLRRYSRVWLIGRTAEELQVFLASSKSLSSQSRELVRMLIRLRRKEVSFADFLVKVQKIDKLAFNEYEDSSKKKFWKHKSLLTP